jgi:hypothetical protein
MFFFYTVWAGITTIKASVLQNKHTVEAIKHDLHEQCYCPAQVIKPRTDYLWSSQPSSNNSDNETD